MLYKTHIATSLAVSLPFLLHGEQPLEVLVFNIGLLTIGTTLPDIDEPKSFIGRRTRGVSDGINAIFGHRGVTHTLWAMCFFWMLTVLTPSLYWLAVGYTLHIIQDCFSKSGVRLFLPLKVRIGIPLYRTGSLSEKVFFIGMLLWMGVTIFSNQRAI